MATSAFLARLIGPVMFVVGIAGLLNLGTIRRIGTRLSGEPGLVFVAGVLDVAIGLAIVLGHNVWTPDWRVLVTLLGWAIGLRGLARALAPTWLARNAAPRLTSGGLAPTALVIVAAYGLALTVFGYAARPLNDPLRPYVERQGDAS